MNQKPGIFDINQQTNPQAKRAFFCLSAILATEIAAIAAIIKFVW